MKTMPIGDSEIRFEDTSEGRFISIDDLVKTIEGVQFSLEKPKGIMKGHEERESDLTTSQHVKGIMKGHEERESDLPTSQHVKGIMKGHEERESPVSLGKPKSTYVDEIVNHFLTVFRSIRDV